MTSYIRDWVGACSFESIDDDTLEDRIAGDVSSGHSQNHLMWCPFLI